MAQKSVSEILGRQEIALDDDISSQRVTVDSGNIVIDSGTITIDGGNVTTTNLNIVESLTGNSSTTHTLSQTSKGISIINFDLVNNLTFTINGITLTVIAGGTVNGSYADFTEIIITNTSNCSYEIAVLA